MYLDTANVSDIKKALKTGIFKGVTTNPTLMKAVGKPRFHQIEEIMTCNPAILFVQVLGDTTQDLLKDFHKVTAYANIHKYPIGIKVPMHYQGLEAVKLMKQEIPDIKILGTAIYSAEQVILSALAGCDMVAPYVNRMQNNGIDAYEQIHKMRNFIDARHISCEILAASFKNTMQIVEALVQGAHSCTIPFGLAQDMMNKALVTSAINVFNEDGKSIG